MSDRCNETNKLLRAIRCSALSATLVIAPMVGCSMLDKDSGSANSVRKSLHDFLESDRESKKSSDTGQVANPPAKTIRFDGNEVVLGRTDIATISQARFETQLKTLLTNQQNFSAAKLVEKHLDTAEHMLWANWATTPGDRTIQFAAKVWDQQSTAKAPWTRMLSVATQSPSLARQYSNMRMDYVRKLQSDLPTDTEAEALQRAAQALKHSLPLCDALQLLAIRELMQEKHAWAKSLFQQSQEAAQRDLDIQRASNLGLMVAATETRMGDLAAATQTWEQTVKTYCETTPHPELNSPYLGFWRRAIEVKPANASWPDDIAAFWQTTAKKAGVETDPLSPPELYLWAGLAHVQFEHGEYQKALINFKKAETSSGNINKLWLRIAESNCLSALGQAPAAAALLSGPIASEDPTISSAATAAMGSAKLKAGTYQLGAQLLNKSLNETPGTQWPGRLRAEADLALAKLIIGDTEMGLESLHAVQANFERAGDTFSLIQALRNEARIAEVESRLEDVKAISARIANLELRSL